ncbi:MAG: CHAT domain-containing protein [Cyanobacteria bacterium P01_E01_bin.42]
MKSWEPCGDIGRVQSQKKSDRAAGFNSPSIICEFFSGYYKSNGFVNFYRVMIVFYRSLCTTPWYLSLFALGLTAIAPSTAKAASPLAANDGTQTLISQQGNQFEITGGTTAGNNLFHSFQEFGLNAGQVANFLSAPSIHNILGRVIGGDPSIIDGLIQVTGGNSNLYLMNPAGMIFGANARLNVLGDFTATTATGIGFGGDRWFNAAGTNDYSELQGNPMQFAFDLVQAGAIVNGGNLAVKAGQNLTLMGGNVINTGTLQASGGKITVAAIPNTALVKISHADSLLSLEIEAPRDLNGKMLPIAAKDLPTLLTGSGVETGLNVENDVVKIANSGVEIPHETGMAITSGTLDVAGTIGGEVNVLGDRVALLNTTIDASGTTGGGNIRIGGDFQGQGDIFNASETYVGENSFMTTNALENGDGGRVIIWADKTTRFLGAIGARGGQISGDGGFVEVSGREILDFRGSVDTSAHFGRAGTLLLDPTDINIVASGTPAPANAGDLLWASGEDIGTQSIGVDYIRTLLGTGNVTLQASNDITWGAGVTLEFNSVLTKDFTLEAGNAIAFDGIIQDSTNAVDILNVTFTANGTGITSSSGSISAGGGNITLSAPSGAIALSTLNLTTNFTLTNANGGNVTLSAAGKIETGIISTQGDAGGGGTGGNVSITGSSLQINAAGSDQNLTNSSITTTGATGLGGSITISLGTSPFTLGNATTNGTLGAITSGDATLAPSLTLTQDTTLGNITILLPAPTTASPTTVSSATSATNSSVTTVNSATTTIPYTILANNSPASLPYIAPYSTGLSSFFSPNLAFTSFDAKFSNTFQQYIASGSGGIGSSGSLSSPGNVTNSSSGSTLGSGIVGNGGSGTNSTNTAISSPNTTISAVSSSSETDEGSFNNNPASNESENGVLALSNLLTQGETNTSSSSDGDDSEDELNLARAQASLEEIYRATGVKPALLYVIFIPPVGNSTNNAEESGNDRLFLMLVPPSGDPAIRPVPVNRELALRVGDRFRNATINTRRPTSFLRPSQKLYEWLIEPVAEDLERLEIHHLTFLLDSGLRSIPVAALHDGEQFLVERYSLSLMPSMALTDLSYADVRGMNLLAMGAETFDDQNPLPAAGAEVDLLTNQLWEGDSYLNEDFTVDTLLEARQQNSYRMIHLATHGKFESGSPDDSFIYLGAGKLPLSQIRELGLHDPPVELLVLSACETALGDVQAELGFAGLAVMAGVKSALGSLWQVSDSGTLGLMTTFYEQLKEAPIKAEALRRSQLSMIRGETRLTEGEIVTTQGAIALEQSLTGGGDLSHPYFWSPFTLIGTPW